MAPLRGSITAEHTTTAEMVTQVTMTSDALLSRKANDM
jgi:hypothetical protein